ncbi:MAG: hypothetical protein KF773_16775 [Deltaproteobacteria bacterium]|nr:hypothetical protein [Deltaproteobacteria bacterium]
MAMRAAAMCVVLVACGDPIVEIEVAATIPVGRAEVAVTVRDPGVDHLVLAVDGADVAFAIEQFPAPATCGACFDFLVRFPAIEVDAGEHELAIRAVGAGGSEIGSASAGVTFTDAPAVRRIEPSNLGDLAGVGTIEARYGVLARRPATAALSFDGVPLAHLTDAACRTECELRATVDTATPAAGRRSLVVDAVAAGETTHVDEPLQLTDVVRVRGLTFNDLPIDLFLSTPDVEVYVYDATDGRMLGCAPPSAFRDVRQAHVAYTLAADVQNVVAPISMFDTLRGLPPDHLIRFEVWEDDDGMECPAPPDPDRPDANADDLLGVSPAMTLAQWRAAGPISFGKLDVFDVAIGRPLVR